jgi:hypothetical protein
MKIRVGASSGIAKNTDRSPNMEKMSASSMAMRKNAQAYDDW